MSRSVVLSGTERCPRCMLPLRWCVCDIVPPAETPLRADVLLHVREQWRPTSTGKLLERALTGTRVHVYHRTGLVPRETVVEPGRELWVLHPRGEMLDPAEASAVDPSRLQVLLIDGSWGEASRVVGSVEDWGRQVRLPLSGESRYWLRSQQGDHRHSTVEALLGLLGMVGQHGAADRLRLHFELHVYAALRSRGRKDLAMAYLANSPVRSALPEALERLHERRPNLESALRRGIARGERWGRAEGGTATSAAENGTEAGEAEAPDQP